MNMKKNLIKCVPVMGFAVCALALSSCAHVLTASAAKALFDSYESEKSYETILKINLTRTNVVYQDDVLQRRRIETIRTDRTHVENAETGAISGDSFYIYHSIQTYILGSGETKTVSTIEEVLLTKVGSSYYKFTNDNGTYTDSTVTTEVANEEVSIVFASLQETLIPANNSEITSRITGEEDAHAVYEQSGESLDYQYNSSESLDGGSISYNVKFLIDYRGLLSQYSNEVNSTTLTDSKTTKNRSGSSISTFYNTTFTKLSNLGDRSTSSSSSESTTTEDSAPSETTEETAN